MAHWNRVAWDAEKLIARVEIEELLFQWNDVVDNGRWDEYEDLFAHENSIDFSSIGSKGTDAASHRDYLRDVAWAQTSGQHHILGNLTFIELDRNAAQTRCLCLATVRMTDGSLYTVAVVYRDWFVRTDDGWRIKRKECHRVVAEPDGGAIKQL